MFVIRNQTPKSLWGRNNPMANTYTQIYIHFVFVVKFRNRVIQSGWKEELYKYISGIVRNHGHKVLALNGMPDHIHLFVGFRPNQSMSDFMQDVKGSSSKWINEKKLVPGKFEWQSGFGAFSYGKSQISEVIKYIENQENHHNSKTFREEYLEFLSRFEIEFNEAFIFKELE
jgi:putative transposase